MPDFALETALIAELAVRDGGCSDRPVRVIGLDEAGRGPWAGPVIAAAVWLDPARLPEDLRIGLDDSKVLTGARRAALHDALHAQAAAGAAAIGVGRAEVDEIDRLNILRASLAAMARAAAALRDGAGWSPDGALVDGRQVPPLACRARAVVGGDGRSLSIAAASIIAKVVRDREMAALAARHPGYGWERNRGYGTAEHRAALARLGVTPHHRRSFRPVRAILGAGADASSRTP